LRWDELGIAGHPFIKTPNTDRSGKEGAMFRNAFMTTPLCSPSRASFLTGQYAHTHGIIDNVDRSAASHRLVTFPLLLHQSGYETAFIGKWHMGNDDRPRPGFDRWVSFKGQGTYLDPDINNKVASRWWKYIHYLELKGMDELYDFKTDPYEMKNLINQPSAARTLAAMKREMERLLKEATANSKNEWESGQWIQQKIYPDC
jgi:arylsulfatase A-like enzyme